MLNEEDIALFRENIQGAKRIQQNTFVAPRSVNTKKKSEKREIREKQDTLFYFSA